MHVMQIKSIILLIAGFFVQFWILIDILLKIRNGIRSIFEILDFKFL